MPTTYCAVDTAHYVQNTQCSKIQYDADHAKNFFKKKNKKNVETVRSWPMPVPRIE